MSVLTTFSDKKLALNQLYILKDLNYIVFKVCRVRVSNDYTSVVCDRTILELSFEILGRSLM